MSEPTVLQSAPPSPKTRPSLLIRLALFIILIGLAICAWYVIFKTPFGQQLRNRRLVADWVLAHRVIAPLILVVAYVILSVLMLPVWWIQALAGYCFGLVMGILWCEIGAVIGAVISLLLSRWLVGEWFRERFESRMAKLHRINEKLGHNGLLVVMGVRLCHLLPFGLSNYLFGLTRITVMDVAIGTFSGGFVAIAIWVAIGVGHHLVRSPHLWIILGAINALLLIPLAFRYLKPQWFKRIGVE